MEKKYKRSVFIAYHGSEGTNGTAQLALNLKDYIDKIDNKLHLTSYCGPDTDENTYEDHFENVIPYSKLFLFVVNDLVPTNDDGSLSFDKCKYIIKEIECFKSLLVTNDRSPKDFAVFYSGNKFKTRKDISLYIKRLLKNIDPEEEFYIGNHYYIVKLDNISNWIENRLNPISEQLIDNLDYYPFSVLEEKVIYNIDNNITYFAIQMDRGMGKTTFIKRFFNTYNNEYFIFPFYIEKNYDCSREKFYWDLIDFLRSDKKRISPFNINNNEEFINFLLDLKKTYFKDTKMIFIFDGIDNIPSNESSLLSLFENITMKCDNIYFIFTSKIYHEIENSYTCKFLGSFRGEKIIFEKNNPQYLKFLYSYFNDKIITFFSNDQSFSVSQISQYFDNLEPKNILSFSIIMKLVSIYKEKNNNEKNNHMIFSLKNAMNFFYKYIEHEYSRVVLLDVIKILSVIATSSLSVSYHEIFQCSNISIDNTIFDQYPFLSIFIYESSENHLKFIHDDMCNIITLNCQNEINQVLSTVYNMIINSKTNFNDYLDFLQNNFIYIKALPFLCKTITSEELEKIYKHFDEIDYQFLWGRNKEILHKETFLLNFLLSEKEQISSPEDIKKCALLAFDLYLSGKYSLARDYFEISYKAMKQSPTFIEENKRLYVSVLTRYSSVLQELHEFTYAEELYFQSMVYYEELYNKNEISIDKLVFNWICLTHVYYHCGNLSKQNKTLKQINHRFKLLKNNALKNEIAFYHFSYSYYYLKKQRYKKALIEINKTIDYYENIDYSENDFLGNVLECYSIKSKILIGLKAKKEICSNFINHSQSFMENECEKIKFNNIDFELRAWIAFAKLYNYIGETEKLENTINLANYIISSLSKEEKNNNIIMKHEEDLIELSKILEVKYDRKK